MRGKRPGFYDDLDEPHPYGPAQDRDAPQAPEPNPADLLDLANERAAAEARRLEFEEELRQKLDAGRIDHAERRYLLDRYDNERLVEANVRDEAAKRDEAALLSRYGIGSEAQERTPDYPVNEHEAAERRHTRFEEELRQKMAAGQIDGDEKRYLLDRFENERLVEMILREQAAKREEPQPSRRDDGIDARTATRTENPAPGARDDKAAEAKLTRGELSDAKQSRIDRLLGEFGDAEHEQTRDHGYSRGGRSRD